jgi:3-oxoacyl-[acyl-carrier-protein] synthase II
MNDARRETWITGLGIVSCLGEGLEAHWQRLNEAPPQPDTVGFAPYVVHRLPPLEFDRQIPKKGDQRQMEQWQRLGVYAAGLALDSAGVKGNADLLSRMDMIVAAGGGERDEAVDAAILTGLPKAESRQTFLNERLMSDLRPTLFLAQLSNLLAGNISIVHGVTGSSRTFMGEEAAGVDGVRIGFSRVESGQSDIILVGGSYNAERRDLLLLYAAGGHALKDGFVPIWERAERGGGIAFGSLGAFLVMESRDHALARGSKALARLSSVQSGRSNRQPGAVTAALSRMWENLASVLQPGRVAVISGASGAAPATGEERAWLESIPKVPVCATGTYLGHGFEPQFPMNIALASLAIAHEKLPAPTTSVEPEQDLKGTLAQVVVTGVGHWRGEGLALVEAVR